MQTLVELGCGLDVHQATVVACLLTVQKDGRVPRQAKQASPDAQFGSSFATPRLHSDLKSSGASRIAGASMYFRSSRLDTK